LGDESIRKYVYVNSAIYVTTTKVSDEPQKFAMEVNAVSPGLARWAERLKDLTVSPLTRDYPEAPSDEAARVKRPIEAVETLASSEKLSDAVRSFHASGSPPELLLTAYVILISRLTGDEDIAIGTNAEPHGQPFVLRVSVSPKESFIQLLSKVKEVC
jgi:L-2-aminoadipate reductase